MMMMRMMLQPWKGKCKVLGCHPIYGNMLKESLGMLFCLSDLKLFQLHPGNFLVERPSLNTWPDQKNKMHKMVENSFFGRK
jgi:hypothetical protein